MVSELGRALRAKEVSSVELTQRALQRLQKQDARAMRAAEAADRELAAGNVQNRPLLGIPYAVNDRIGDDATVVVKLTNGGAVLVATLSAPEGAVAAGHVPFAIGIETAGATLVSGVTVLRPTYGAVSRHGAMPRSWTMDKLGPVARTAADCNTIFGTIVGEDPRDPSTAGVFVSGRASWVSSSVMMRAANKRLAKIGIVKGTPRVDALQSLGHTIAEIALPDLPYVEAATIIVEAESASAMERPSPILAVDYLRAVRVRTKIRQALLALFEQHDVIAAPIADPAVTAGMNLLGAPAVCLAPSLQLNAAPANETLLLNVAIHLEGMRYEG